MEHGLGLDPEKSRRRRGDRRGPGSVDGVEDGSLLILEVDDLGGLSAGGRGGIKVNDLDGSSDSGRGAIVDEKGESELGRRGGHYVSLGLGLGG